MRSDPTEPTQPEAAVEPEAADLVAEGDEAETPQVRPNRRERRAARNGGPSAAVQGPHGGRNRPVPAKQRDYATRRRGG